MKNTYNIPFVAIFILYLLCYLPASVSGASVKVHRNNESGLLTWVSKDSGFSIELIQLLPDFIRAIYAKHDFPSHEIERVASYCVFGTIIKNTSDKTLSYDVSQWRYTSNDISRNIKTKTQWLKEWRDAGIIFSWTLLPDAGVFEVGDWQQGFTTIAHPRNTKFDLTYSWMIENKNYSSTIENVVCAPETLPEM